ncbi:MAG: hypothetical protein HYV34_04830 [Candidatus Kerfeldbacteria bacterium]|nr:hypothetical protein [Candidatus Kerfeldbacteria bacterium]
MKTIDRIFIVVLDTQEKVNNLDLRVGRLEKGFERAFNTMDDISVILKRHETEITSNRAGLQRIDTRVTKLEERAV